MTITEGTPTDAGRGRVLWRPPADAGERSRIGRYMALLAAERGRAFGGYDELWEWSVTDLDGFWRSIWDHFSLDSRTPVTSALADPVMPGARWFPEAEVNYAAHALRSVPLGPGLVGGGPALRARFKRSRGPSCAASIRRGPSTRPASAPASSCRTASRRCGRARRARSSSKSRTSGTSGGRRPKGRRLCACPRAGAAVTAFCWGTARARRSPRPWPLAPPLGCRCR